MAYLSRLIMVILLWSLPLAVAAQSPQAPAASPQPLLKPADSFLLLLDEQLKQLDGCGLCFLVAHLVLLGAVGLSHPGSHT